MELRTLVAEIHAAWAPGEASPFCFCYQLYGGFVGLALQTKSARGLDSLLVAFSGCEARYLFVFYIN